LKAKRRRPRLPQLAKSAATIVVKDGVFVEAVPKNIPMNKNAKIIQMNTGDHSKVPEDKDKLKISRKKKAKSKRKRNNIILFARNVTKLVAEDGPFVASVEPNTQMSKSTKDRKLPLQFAKNANILLLKDGPSVVAAKKIILTTKNKSR
jgi:hypothetical protein